MFVASTCHEELIGTERTHRLRTALPAPQLGIVSGLHSWPVPVDVVNIVEVS